MVINKKLDFSGNIKITLDIQEILEGQLNGDSKKISLALNSNEESVHHFLDQLDDNLSIKINGKEVQLNYQKNSNTFTAEIPKIFESLEIFAQDKILAKYSKQNGNYILETENLIDSYFIKNSILNGSINFHDIVEATHKITTDLHTHYAGAPTAKGLIELALEKDFKYPTFLLQKIGIQTNTEEKSISLRTLSQEQLNLLEKEMQISVGEQIRFSNEEENLEKIYSFRQPFFRDCCLTPDLLELIAKEYATSGVSYVELSGSQIFDLEKEPQMLKLATEIIPQLEEKYGVKLRFLGAMTRYDDVEWSLDQLEKLKLVANNPYIAGLDIVGHETNSTLDIVDNIEPYMIFAKEKGLDWTFRFHAGENPSHPENVKEALKLAEKHGVNIRIGHGLYGIDEETLDLAKRTNAIIEINCSSNLSLNNVTDVEEMQPLNFYLQNGVRVVLGTDSPGIYQTDSQQELCVATRILSRNNLPKDLLDKINDVENFVINRRNSEEKRLHSIEGCKSIPQSAKFNGLSNNWSPEVEVRKKQQREEKINSKIEKIESLSGQYIAPEEIQETLSKNKKIPFIISGASKSNWKQLTEEQKIKIQEEMKTLLENLDSKKYILVTGGTDYGVEEIVHNLAKDKKFDVLGVLTEEADVSEIKNPNITHYTIAQGNWWAKSSFVMDNIIKPCNGKVLFVAGGPIVGDEILSAIYHKLGKEQLFLMDNVGGSSERKAKQNPKFAVDCVAEIIETIQKDTINKSLSILKKYRKQNTNKSHIEPD